MCRSGKLRSRKYNANNEYPRKLWNDAYIHINTLNYMIENAAKVDVTTTALTAAQRDQYLGEAYFMRAYNYFHLVEQFGDVTLTTTYNASPALRPSAMIWYVFMKKSLSLIC